MPSDITFLGKTNFRGQSRLFGIRQPDRLMQTYILGKTGMGKTTLLDTQIRQDIMAGRGCTLIDPHGDLVSGLADWIPKERKQDVIYLDLTDSTQPWGYNPLTRIGAERQALVAAGIMEALRKTWRGNVWGVKMEHILRNTLLTLLNQPHATLADIPRLLNDKEFRKRAITRVENPAVYEFWTKEFAGYSQWAKSEATAPILNKIGGFLANPVLRRVLVEPRQEIRLRQVLDEGRILLVNLSRGQIGDDAAMLAGSLFMSALGLAAFSRADTAEEQRNPHTLYVDEFQNFTTLSLVSMLSELRKYQVGMVLANQYLAQLESEIRDALLGNVGTMLAFRLSPADARYMAREFAPVCDEYDLLNLPKYQFYIKLMIEGSTSQTFSGNGVRFEDITDSI